MKKYAKPSIVRVGNPLYAKHGSSSQSYHFIREQIEGIKIQELIEKYGSPLFVFSERALRLKYQQTFQSLKRYFPNVVFAWSYKTNYLNGICSVYHQEGAIAEVVSHFEYEKARSLGIAGKDIIFNGPYKPIAALEQAIADGAQIHIDSFQEIDDIQNIVKKTGRKATIGIRVNLNAGIYPIWSRFGFNYENGQAWAAIRKIAQCPELKLGGLHCHIGTFILDPMAYARAAHKLTCLIQDLESLVGYNIEYLDIGGGFASLNHLKGIYQPPEVAVPTAETYAKALYQELSWMNARTPAPRLILELGRHLVDEAGYLITQVVAEKLLSDGRRSYVIDAGVNLLYTSTWYNFKVELDRETEGIMEPSILHGPLCMNIDTVNEAILLPRLERYQNLILSPVGAYNITQSMQFIQYRPAVIMINLNSEIITLRRKEILDDLNRLEQG